MATPKQDEPLQVLNRMFNDVLVQTGKHLRASNKDGSRDLAGASNAIRVKTSDSLVAYHYALDDLESEITRAKAVLLRDLERLRTARNPAPVPTPAPVPAPQPVAPPAPMMDMPSAAAHSISAQAFAPKQETKTVAPFPDMGMGMSTDIVDLTASEKKPSPRVSTTPIKPPPRGTPPVRHEVKPSPKPPHKATPPAKVTPVPPPQIPRLQQPPQPKQPAQPAPASAPVAPPAPSVPAAPSASATQPAQENSLDATLSLPPTGAGGVANAKGANGESNFTHMQFSLAPSNNDSQAAPTAPMPEFDLASFAPQAGNNGVVSTDNIGGDNSGAPDPAASSASNNPAAEPPKEAEKPDTNIDDLFNLGDNNGGSDNMFDLGGGGVNDSTFDDMMFFGNNDSDMAQFDDAYFGL